MMNNITEPQIAEMALRFLQRVDLKGSEVPAAATVMQWLELKMQGTQDESATTTSAE